MDNLLLSRLPRELRNLVYQHAMHPKGHSEAIAVFLSETTSTVRPVLTDEPFARLDKWLSRKAINHRHAFGRVGVSIFTLPDWNGAYELFTMVRDCFPNSATRISLEIPHHVLDPAGDQTSPYVANPFLRFEAFDIPLWIDLAVTRRKAKAFALYWDDRMVEAKEIVSAFEYRHRQAHWESTVAFVGR